MADSGRYTLTRAERLRGIKRIDDLWNGTGHSMTAFPIRMVYMLSKAEADEAPLSMMVTVPKRLFHHAVSLPCWCSSVCQSADSIMLWTATA